MRTPSISLLLGCLLSLVTTSVFAEKVYRQEPILPVPAFADSRPHLSRLGDLLFHDSRLSADQSISCASCHNLADNGSDTRPFSLGVGDAIGRIRSLSVYNASLNHVQFWDGRAASLEAQVDGPVHDPLEMASNWPEIIARLSADEAMRQHFDAAFTDGITAANIRSALAEFQRTLVTLDAPFDRWLRGDDQALSADALKGYKLFKRYGCVACHQGANVGGNMFARMGSLENYFALKGEAITQADLGRFNVTGNPEHRHVFKVPGLRTAALNRFFFHDSSADSLEEAILMMARFQLGRDLPSDDVKAIAAFIHSLVGHHPLMEPNP